MINFVADYNCVEDMDTRYYDVAGHRFAVSATDEVFGLMTNYEPFEVEADEAVETVFRLEVKAAEASVTYEEELRQEEEGQEIVCGHTAEGCPVFEYRWGGETAGWLVCSEDYRRSMLTMAGPYPKLAVDNALMVLFALATAHLGTALFHAAVVSHHGRGFLFLGKSGTGKSTHARLWLKYIPDTALVNDDNPVVRVSGDECRVYGSPWSGKTPCYRQVSYPVGAIVRLSQAPYNKIHRQRPIEAYAALVPSISGKRWDKAVADGLHATENALAMKVPVWHLECLPDEAAAQLCQSTIDNHEHGDD